MIKDLLTDQKIFDAHADVMAIMQENKIDENSYIQAMRFEKAAFKDTSEVLEWLSRYGFYSPMIEEIDGEYQITIYDPEQFDEVVLLEVRRGVNLVIGKLAPVETSPFVFSLRNKDARKFSDKLPSIIELAKVVEGYHASYGKVKITREDLASMVKNFSDNVVGIDISLDFEHSQAEAAAWLKRVFLSEDGNTLLGEVKWTPGGVQALNDKKFRYFSPEFTHNYVHPHTRKEHGPTLLGGGLVNRPFLKMEAIVEMKDKHINQGENVSTITLKDHEDKVNALGAEIALKDKAIEAAGTQIKSLKETNEQLAAEVKSLKEAAEKSEREARNQKLFSENKINAAQLKALNEGKDLFEVLSLSEPMNPAPKGHGSQKDAITLSEEEMALCKKLGLTAEEFVNGNK